MNGTLVMVVLVGIMMIGMIAAGLVVLHHLLKKKEKQEMMTAIKAVVIPEIESMTNRTLERNMDMIMNKSIEVTKQMMESSY